jgi:hypothetical protein
MTSRQHLDAEGTPNCAERVTAGCPASVFTSKTRRRRLMSMHLTMPVHDPFTDAGLSLHLPSLPSDRGR